MPWFKVDDKFHSHVKAARAGVDALGLWVLCGSWCMDQMSDGFVPDYIALRIDPKARRRAAKLVAAGLWVEAERDGDRGWLFHDWSDLQPTRDEVESKRELEREKKARWREKAKRNSNGEFTTADSEMSPGVSTVDNLVRPPGSPEGCPPVPDPTRPDPIKEPTVPSSSAIENRARPTAAERDREPDAEVVELCSHLADRVRQNGHDANVGVHWHRACRLMIEADRRTPDQIRAAIDWATADPFWSTNIRSMQKLREQYTTLQAQARNGTRRSPTNTDALTEARRRYAERTNQDQLIVIKGEAV